MAKSKKHEKKHAKNNPAGKKISKGKHTRSVSKTKASKAVRKTKPKFSTKNKKLLYSKSSRKGNTRNRKGNKRAGKTLSREEKLNLKLFEKLYQEDSKKKGYRKSQQKTSDRRKFETTAKSAKLSVNRKKGSNVIIIKADSKNVQKIILGIRAFDFKKMFSYMINKKAYPFFPRAVAVIIKLKRKGVDAKYITMVSEPGEAITVEFVIDFIAKCIAKLNSDMLDFLEKKYDDPIIMYKIEQIAVRFIYTIN